MAESYYLAREGVSGKRRERKLRGDRARARKEGRENHNDKRAFFTYTPKGSNFIKEYYGIIGIDSETDFQEVGDDGKIYHISPNPYAVGMARNVINSTNNFSENALTSLNYFAYLLRDLATHMRKKEEEYLKMKIFQLEKGAISPADDILDPLKDALKRKSMSEAYSLLLTGEKSYEELQRQLEKAIEFRRTHPDSIANTGMVSRMNDTCADFSLKDIILRTEAGKKLWQRMINGVALKRYDVETTEDWSKIAELVAKAALEKEAKNTDMYEAYVKNVQDIFRRNLLIKEKGYKEVLESIKNKDKARLDKLIKENENLKSYKQYSKHVKREKKVGSKYELRGVEAFLDDVLDQVNQGLVGEHYTSKAFGRVGAITYNVGTQMVDQYDVFGNRLYARQGKNDEVVIDTLRWSIDYDGIIDKELNRLNKRLNEYRESEKDGGASMDKLLQDIAELRRNMSDLFVLKVNTKFYKSNRDLGVLYNTTIEHAAGRLSKVSKILRNEAFSGNKSHREVFHSIHQARSFDNLISMLNNTFSKGYMHNYVPRVEHWIAAACFVWMWDGVEDDLQEMISGTPDKLNTIYLFQSGGAFFTASQIIMATVEELENQNALSDYSRFVDVEINPTTGITDTFYQQLREEYPVSLDMGYAQQMEALKQRWEDLRNFSLKNTTMSIKFNQRELDRLLGNLSVMNNL